MELKLYERRTTTRLIDAWIMNEDVCLFCHTNGSVRPLESLKPNIHGLQDTKGTLMVEQRVSCQKCGVEWVDVFCRMYPLNDQHGNKSE